MDIPEKDAHFEVAVIDPQKNETKVPTAREHGSERGTFWKTDLPGEYVLVARGWGKDVDGKPLENLPPARARFMVYQDEAEMSAPGGGSRVSCQAGQRRRRKVSSSGRLSAIPEGAGDSAASAGQSTESASAGPIGGGIRPREPSMIRLDTLVSSGILACFMLFVGLLCLEWFLRRRWGLV